MHQKGETERLRRADVENGALTSSGTHDSHIAAGITQVLRSKRNFLTEAHFALA
jgi:hypothetical protein